MIGEKGKAQLQRDSKKNIHMVITETQKMPISYTQARYMAGYLLLLNQKKHCMAQQRIKLICPYILAISTSSKKREKQKRKRKRKREDVERKTVYRINAELFSAHYTQTRKRKRKRI